MFKVAAAVLVVAMAVLFAPSDALAQRIRLCPPPTHSVESFKERLLELSRRGQTGRLSTLVSGAMAPLEVTPTCAQIRGAPDLDAVLDQLIRWAGLLEKPELHEGFFRGVRGALAERPTRPARSLPADALRFTVEGGRTPEAVNAALRLLLRSEDSEAALPVLLEWTRAETGPPTYPNLPEVIAGSVYVMEGMRNAEAFRAALESDLSLIRSPHVRCRAKHGRLPPEVRRQTAPDCPPQPWR